MPYLLTLQCPSVMMFWCSSGSSPSARSSRAAVQGRPSRSPPWQGPILLVPQSRCWNTRLPICCCSPFPAPPHGRSWSPRSPPPDTHPRSHAPRSRPNLKQHAPSPSTVSRSRKQPHMPKTRMNQANFVDSSRLSPFFRHAIRSYLPSLQSRRRRGSR